MADEKTEKTEQRPERVAAAEKLAAEKAAPKEPVTVPSETTDTPDDPLLAPPRKDDREAAQLTTPEAAKKSTLKDVFLKLSGYEAEDIIDLNHAHRTVVTANGGKYLLSKNVDGGIRILQGPAYPKMLEAE